MGVRDHLGDFETLEARALQLERAGDNVFRSVHLWTPSLSRATYGGQLVAHSVEAAFRTVDVARLNIHSLQLKFLSPGDSTTGVPILYTVKPLHEGRSFCTRFVLATQQGRNIIAAFVSFHEKEPGGIEHQISRPVCSTKSIPTESEGTCSSSSCLSNSVQHVEEPLPVDGDQPGEVGAAHLRFTNFMERSAIRSVTPLAVWLRMDSDGWARLRTLTGIPVGRLHIIVVCWCSDFVLALSSMFPHGLPNQHLRFIASLNHTIHFHHPEQICVNNWFQYEVFSPWAAHGRGITNGQMYGEDGTLWMSTSQETLIRMTSGYKSKL